MIRWRKRRWMRSRRCWMRSRRRRMMMKMRIMAKILGRLARE
jgi:hypothetical protein